MTKERLQVLSLEALQEIANRSSISFDQNTNRDALIDQILEAHEEERTERESSYSAPMRVKEKKFDNILDEDISPDDDETFSLPASYNETRIVLLLRDPQWAFAYWDLNESDLEFIGTTSQSRLKLRVYQHDIGRVDTRKGGNPFEIPVKKDDRSWYINLPVTGKRYFIDLIAGTGKTERVICTSNAVESPKISLHLNGNTASEELFYNILAVSGLQDANDFTQKGGIPQRIISLLDTQYLHLQG